MKHFSDTQTKLANVGLKATQQRLVILETIYSTDSHPSAEQIFEEINQDYPSISLGTVYSTLETFVAKGLIQKVLVKDRVMRYDGNTELHNHIHCTNTQEIIDFEDEEFQSLISGFLKRKKIENLSIKSFSLHIQGEKLDEKKPLKFI